MSITAVTHLLADADESVVHDGAVAALDVEEGVVEAVRARAAEHGGLHDTRDDLRVRQLHVTHVLHLGVTSDRAPRDSAVAAIVPLPRELLTAGRSMKSLRH